jgi:glucuronokinase
MVIVKRAFARAGLIGNPSDGYNGKTIAFTVRDFYAEVKLHESETLQLIAGDSDNNRFDSPAALHHSVTSHGYYGGIRLLKATIKVFVDYCQKNNIQLVDKNFSLEYSTNIPQQVGMAGSSAIIIATLRCLMEFYGVTIDKRIQPTIALSAETSELGIGGGLQDRVVQVYEGLVSMDFSRMENVAGYQCGYYEPLNPELLPRAYLAWRPASSEPTEVFHNDLRARFDSGDPQVVAAMKRFAELTDQARDALQANDRQLLAALLDANFDCRQSFCRLNSQHVEMVQVARNVGVAAKYAGSGGAIVGVYHDETQFAALQNAMNQIGCQVIKPLIGV